MGAQESSTANSAWVLLPAAEDVVADRDPGDALADLVDHAGRVQARGTPGASSGLPPAIIPERTFQSNGFTLAALTAIRICPGPACGSGASATSSTSGPP